LKLEELTMNKLSSKEESLLWLRTRKESDVFDDWCNERDKIVRLIEHHIIVKDALITELYKWDSKISKIFGRAISKEIKSKNFIS